MAEVLEHVWITLSDGCRLGARIWLPEGARDTPVPAVLEYIPYRKRDGTRTRDEPMHGYFAENGYASVRVDMRGTGESDGHMADEYLAQEQDDALEVLSWIAAQDWCTGNIGMMGKSWGGFNCLQIAARRPPELKAVIPVYFTDDRFRDDIHFMGGCLLNDNMWWGSIMLAYQARPLDPAIVGDSWREDWLKRIDDLPFFPGLWAAHQRYDDYWKHGSVQDDYSDITCPVLAFGGWADSYTNSVPRMLENLSVPNRGVIGPWGHVYPHDGVPGPAIGWLQEAVRWWDQWLKGEETGVMDEPQLRAYINDAVKPEGTRTYQPGRWVSEAEWPSPEVEGHPFWLTRSGLSDTPDQGEMSIRSPQSHGKASGEWMSAGVPGEMPTDQRLDDGGSLNFDTDVLAEDVEILGRPYLDLTVTSDSPVAQIAVRLSDVLPSGEVLRVSYQVLNLTHRDSHAAPAPLEPGKPTKVRVPLHMCGHRFAAGHKIRVSVGTAYWPIVWPAPYAATLSFDLADACLTLPRRAGADTHDLTFPEPAHGPFTPITQVDPGSVARSSTQDHLTGETVYVTDGVGGVFGEGVLRFDEIGTQIAHSLRRELRIRDDDPLSARAVIEQSYDTVREDAVLRTETRLEMSSTETEFHIQGVLRVFEDGQELRQREWNEVIPRNLI
ncbi:CocE/NonD family hydrolase [Thalassorhabdomicrobium marinisediminis]|uniref:Peptidase S15 n=1 Tax=Thalassorhabdomicrobium marinisediminis TaxID=2170577 RepID=A0A2T7G036_9RHOB|nr:CocE/NonD family hydrolase [Thalassorhabdomicrobium marinisediminis]PVA07780.1 peptidase S15 [Thalassorhabdomicrobium marinisediminis]